MTEAVQNPADELKIDTSKMSEGKRAAVEMAEAAREKLEAKSSFAASLFMGDYDWERIHPFPAQTGADLERGDVFLAQIAAILEDYDADEVDATGIVPDDVREKLRVLGAYGIKIPKEYGGLGHQQSTYTRTALLIGSHCANLAAFISAHQSIGVPNPLLLFGTEEQKQKYLPQCAKGALTAFALTEVGAGSDPARLATTAEPDGDDHYLINGTKLWCTNGANARFVVVMAQTPKKEVRGRMRDQVTAFIVDTQDPGFEVVHQSQFMGHRAIYNVALKFTNVRAHKSDIIGGLGAGLRVALTTLNTGRLTLPAAATGMAKRCTEIVRRWANEREQWGGPVGHHPAVADKLARICASTFAMEAMTMLTSGIVDRKSGDFRVEAAMCKLWCTERAWEIVNETMQVRGGRGYETAESLKARGESPDPVERFLRDARITTIFEGSSEILRCMAIAREGMDHHAKIAGDTLNVRAPWGRRIAAAIKSGVFYAPWYLTRLLPSSPRGTGDMDSELANIVRWSSAETRKLARRLFHQMAKHGLGLEHRQLLLGRFVDVATELFAVSATCSFAQHKIRTGVPRDQVVPLVKFFRQDSARRIDALYRAVGKNNDVSSCAFAAEFLKGRFAWIEEGAQHRG